MNDKKGLLMRVGIDQTYGGYNAPINPSTNDYIYMPIPQGNDSFISGMETTYDNLLPYFESWCQKNDAEIQFPKINNISCHLDPDFDFSTYGDQATGRGLRVGDLNEGDFIAFFASFKPIKKCAHSLVYGLYGIMVVDKVMKVADVPENEFHKNAHTRIKNMNKDHWVVFSNPSLSGRFSRAIPIGEFRNGSYRVTKEILDAWGDIGVKDGFIQRSVCPPWFIKPKQFLSWLDTQQVKLINSNWK
ncbi:MAG: Nmad3 family putative nucleotide modification protein [Methylobacter sp.]